MKTKLILFMVIVVLGLAGYVFFIQEEGVQPGVIEDTGNELEKADLIRAHSPRPNQVIASPLVISGEARGYWFFEASFPIRLLDGNGDEVQLTPGYIMTAAEWMTEDFVPFEATVEFKKPATAAGTLLLQKDNPSGLPEHDDMLEIPVRFQ